MLESYKSQSKVNQKKVRDLISDLMGSLPPVCGTYRFGLAITEDEIEVVCLNFKRMTDPHVAVQLPAHSEYDKEDAIDYIINEYEALYQWENEYQ